MNKTAKALLIPIAAFAVTATGVSAFDAEVLERAGLSNKEITAFEEAHDLRMDGDRDGARDVLVEAGIDLETMQKVRDAMHDYRDEMRTAVDDAVEDKDYDAFKEAVADSPLADIITTEDDFELFVEARELKEAGEYAESRAIMEELGLPGMREGFGAPGMKEGRGNKGMGMHGNEAALRDWSEQGFNEGRSNGFRGNQ